ncbi:MAG TPA: single-stranded-DNA-specific exonuclease RecJ [Anaerolineae bacterium]|nr:single-stranded-DNA-specific exonuclease RecJ [Anaerolineae bacterium]
MSTKRWQIYPTLTPEAQKELSNYPPFFRQILFNRGYATQKSSKVFLAEIPSPEHDPFLIHGIEEATNRILFALEKKQSISVYGDYDVDGVTATALLTLFLKSVGGSVTGYIPNRFDEGYSLNKEAITNLHEQGTDLIITVDCGVRSIEEVDYANTLGIDIIISDHHHPGNELPRAFAVIDPKQSDDSYPEKNLAGVGLAYKISSAISQRLNSRQYRAADYLDLVALGTVSDLAPLVGENRSLVRDGIDLLRRTNRQGLYSLMKVCGINPEKVNASNIGYSIGPRLNAAGRLNSALAAYNLLISDDLNEVSKIAQDLDYQNKQRQEITIKIQEKAEKLAIEYEPNPLLLFAADKSFNPGVVGLAASKLAEEFYRPAIVAHIGDKYSRGSCRSIPEFHITEALDQCKDILEHHGGHAAAAGFTVKNENLPELRKRLSEIASSQLNKIDLLPTINADLEIKLSELTPDLLPYLDKLQPTGYGNPQAKFLCRGLQPIYHRQVGRDGNHLKLKVSDGWITYDAIAFNQGYWHEHMPKYIDIIFTFEINEYQGRKNLQLNIKDLKSSNSNL